MNKKSKILTLAGFDPSGGAGVLADVKTFEQHRCVSMSVITANTIQTEDVFESVNWIDKDLISNQLNFLMKRYSFDFVKIGLIQDLELLNELLDEIKSINHKTRAIWDPILSASSGFDFHKDLKLLHSVLEKVYLITPNWNEIKTLSNSENALKGAKDLSRFTKVLLKGGHNEDKLGKDYLFENDEVTSFNPRKIAKSIYPKHGSGCVFSSAIASNLNNGYPLQKSILRSKRYIEHFLASDKGLLGRHKI